MKEYKLTRKLMGTIFTLGVCSNSEKKAHEILHLGVAEIVRLEELLSEFKDNSITSQINNLAYKKPLEIDEETFGLIERSLAISNLTHGDFDITVSPLKKLYNFKNKQFNLPTDSAITLALQGVGCHHLKLNKEQLSISLLQPKLKISFAAIGKGYAAEKVKLLWLKAGVTSGYVNASGDLAAFGTKPDNSPWQIGIANPDNINEMLLHLPINNAAVATSGDYEQFFVLNNKRYSHTINPHTALPVSGIKSVTIISENAELSDALSTAIFVKGFQKGINFVNQLPNTHCVIIDDQNQLYFSKHLNYEETTP